MNLLHEALDAHLQSNYSRTGPGAAVLVALQGEVLYAQGIGIADLSTGEPITPHTNFRLASVSKQFTAMAIQSLERRGLLAYEDNLLGFFPEFAPVGAKITLRYLLTHTSGLLDYEAFVEEQTDWQIGDQEVLAIAAAQTATYFSPGARYRYSNTGYVLLALVVEKVSGMAYADFLGQQIFEPLGMHNTTLYEHGKLIPNRAMGYARNALGQIINSDQGICTATKGDGCIYTSVSDYLHGYRALNKAGRAPKLDDASFPLSGYPNGFYGMGWFFAKRRDGGLEMYHTGNTSGFSNLVIRIPDCEVLIAYFSNMADNPHLLTDFLDELHKFPLLRPESRLVRDLLKLTR
ncbi:beta-lactamase family protein [Pontibacter sp. JH31]|uniref:Beta-lactamase family protein n=2 Tax=Pontibacter aquaedesilientis TaxID=2766980 RepID=A0ABR7XBY4_9BACT|nr:beta-lactamase family protein [Pontibacter aquaedesilientis]